MPTAIVFNSDDEEFHYSHPDKEEETFCGLDWTYEDVYYVGSFASPTSHIEDLMWGSKPDDDVERTPCEECDITGEEWATPEDEK